MSDPDGRGRLLPEEYLQTFADALIDGEALSPKDHEKLIDDVRRGFSALPWERETANVWMKDGKIVPNVRGFNARAERYVLPWTEIE